jgi:HK97 family phage major capsid protein
MELTAEALDKLIADSAAKVLGAKVDALKSEIIADTKTQVGDVEKKILFNQDGHGEIGFSKTLGGSVVDFSSMKALAGMPMNFGPDEAKNGAAMGAAFAGIGSPWKRLSPTMEKFAKLLATGFKNAGLSRLGGAFLEDYFKDCKSQMSMFTKATAVSGQDEGTSADGGYTVPIEFAAVVVEFAFQLSPILSKVWRVPMNTSVTKYPKLSQQEGNYFGGVKITYATEGNAPAANTRVNFEQNVFTANKVILETAFTSELIEDSLINIVNYVTGVITRAYMFELERCVIRGSGSGQPRGIIEDVIVKANAVKRSAGAGQVAMADIYGLEGALDEMFTNLTYITRRSTISKLRAGLTTVANGFLKETWEEAAGNPTMIKSMNGYPYYVTRNCHPTGSLGDIICGDLGYYMLAIRRDMRIDMSDAPYWTTDQIALRLTARYDGMPGTSYGFKVLQGTGS